MGKGIDLARPEAPLHTAVLDELKDQLLIVLLKRLGGKASIPCAEIDDTTMDLFAFRVDENRVFHFELRKKQ